MAPEFDSSLKGTPPAFQAPRSGAVRCPGRTRGELHSTARHENTLNLSARLETPGFIVILSTYVFASIITICARTRCTFVGSAIHAFSNGSAVVYQRLRVARLMATACLLLITARPTWERESTYSPQRTLGIEVYGVAAGNGCYFRGQKCHVEPPAECQRHPHPLQRNRRHPLRRTLRRTGQPCPKRLVPGQLPGVQSTNRAVAQSGSDFRGRWGAFVCVCGRKPAEMD